MKVTSERLDNSQVKVLVELDTAEVEDKLRQTTRKLSREFNVPGYRRGKAPHHAVIRVLGREAVQQQALEDFGNDLYEAAMAEIDFKPYEVGKLEEVEWEPFVMTVLVPVEPEVDLGDYRSVRLPFEVQEVADAAVEEYLEGLREEHAQWTPVERPAEMGDQVVVFVRARVGDETILEEENMELLLEAGSPKPLPGFAEQVVGLKAGESAEFDLSLPAEGAEEGAEPREAHVYIDLNTVRERDMPGMDDELAMMVGDYETLDDLKASVRERLELEARQRAESEYLEQVLEAMVEAAPKIEYPPQAIDREADSTMMQMERNLSASGLPFETFLRMMGKTREMYRQELRPAAEDRLKKRLVLEEISRREGLEAKPEEVEAEIDRMSERMGPQADRMREVLDTPGGRESVAIDLAISRAQERALLIARGEAPSLAEAAAAEQAPEPEAEPAEAEAETPGPAAEAPGEGAEALSEQEAPAGTEEAAE
ncbi:MAG TPA: trigger factor [Anaerolineae bacterium]|nr:trigger factor [Anaerolineae bacterium]